jgi:Tfp pilus assembly protein PilO
MKTTNIKTSAEKKNLSLKVTLGAFILLAVLTLGAGVYFSFKIRDEVSRVNTQATYLEKEAIEKTDTVTKYNRVSAYEPVVFDSIPNSKEVSSFLSDFENIATKNNIKITQIAVGATNVKNKNTNLDLSQTINQKDYYELQIKYTVSGSYQAFLNMMDEEASLRRLNIISDITIVKNSGDVPDNVQVSFTDSIYIKK